MSIIKEVNIILAHGPELSAGGLDYYQLGLWAASLHNCRVLALDPTLPPDELIGRLRAFLLPGKEHRVLLAALEPLRRAQRIIRLLLDEMGINPEFLTVLDLQEALGYLTPQACSLKAQHLIRLAAAMNSRAEPILSLEVPVSTRVLVWGDSFAALKAAVELARLEYSVCMAFPGAGLSPLVPGAAVNQSPEAELLRLLDEARSQAGIRLLPQASLLGVEGAAGDFQVKLATPEGFLNETVGAIILAPELRLMPGDLPAPAHPRLMTLTGLEEILVTPEEVQALRESETASLRVAFLGGDSSPAALRRTLAAVNRLLSLEESQVLLFVRDAKVGAPGLEAALEEAAGAGLIVFKVPALPAVAIVADRPHLTFFDPVMRTEEAWRCDLAILEEGYAPAAGNDELAAHLGLFAGPGGFLQGDNVRNLPVITNRRGIYAAGPGRGVVELDQALAEAEVAVLEVEQLLRRGKASALQGRAVVDRGRCVLCLTCYRLCPHGAISWDNRAIINELACQACGVCASQCPNEAIQIRNFTDDQVVAALETVDPRLTPKIIAFLCKNSAWEAYQAALKMHSTILPLGFTPLRMPCAGKIDIDYLLKAFTFGADGVLVLGCHPDNCKSQEGIRHARWRVEQTQTLLAEAGVDPQRLIYRSLAANAPQDFVAAVNHLLGLLETMKAA
jgi:coenzyme F420-reducing hydrogenase delta subunit/Pyruvate/2-oxoacid:ferredoxin oxidoreductase delta subunit|uniref:Hydrogenase iron-sulfur subunit n=1 Tax=Desulfobacca acetoxidans TaxID=60893 RepID=A0A7V6A5C8_9BACT